MRIACSSNPLHCISHVKSDFHRDQMICAAVSNSGATERKFLTYKQLFSHSQERFLKWKDEKIFTFLLLL